MRLHKKMGEILEFKNKVTAVGLERKNGESTIRREETLQVIERIIIANKKNEIAEDENVILDLEALKDIFSIFSVKNDKVIDLLSELENKDIIKKNDKILIFGIFIVLGGNNSKELIFNILKGEVNQEFFSGGIVQYILEISQEIKKKIQDI